MSSAPYSGSNDGRTSATSPASSDESTTSLVVEFDLRFGDAENDRARDIMLRSGGIAVATRSAEANQVITAVFHSVCDATSAVVDIVDTVAQRSDDPLSGVRMVVYTPEADQPAEQSAESSVRALQLLAHTDPGQILATAPAAVVAGPMLPPGIDLLDRGTWAPSPSRPAERIYEMRVSHSRRGGVTASNLEWARRAVDSAGSFDEYLVRLTEAWQQTVAGNRRMLLISGDSSGDRTAVTAELALRLHAEGALVLYGRWDGEASLPYQAFREALGVYAAGCTTEQLRADLEGWADEIAQLLPEVGARVGGSHLARLPAYVESDRVFEAIQTWLLAILGRTPTLLVLDEVQWAEQSSIVLLAQLWHAFRRRPAMILVTGSDGEAAAGNALDRLVELATHTETGAFERLRLHR